MPNGLWQGVFQLREHLEELSENLKLLKAVSIELDVAGGLRAERECVLEELENVPSSEHIRRLLMERLHAKGGEVGHMENAALSVARLVHGSTQSLLFPLEGVVDGSAPWEELGAVSRFRDRRLKLKRNRKQRQKKRQETAELRRTAPERLQQAEQQADEWRAREIAKDVARIKMEKINEVAEKKVKAEKQQIEEELKLALLVDKLQELRSVRQQKLKKQGHLFPEEDDKFMERVRAAVEEEELRASLAAAETSTSTPQTDDSTKLQNPMPTSMETSPEDLPQPFQQAGTRSAETARDNNKDTPRLPAKFHHYYYGSTTDMESLIEARRSWDTYLCRSGGGSRVPGHWVEPSPPSSSIWASCLKKKGNLI